MKVGQIKKLSLNKPHTEILMFNNNQAGDTVTEELYLELQDPCAVSAVGYALKSDVPVALKFVDMANLNVPDAVEDSGLYLLMVSALEKVEITFDAPETSEGASVRATIKTVFGG